ncbi:MAG TPA: protein translocase subunit SecF [Patescibacteria group bacterium]|nr:protein translocase subunit SecF [Patescibacteria group bacterium]
MNIIKYRNIFFAISLLVIIPGIISLALFGLNLSVDFTGGSVISLAYGKAPSISTIQHVFTEIHEPVYSLTQQGQQVTIKTKPLTDAQHTTLLQIMYAQTGPFQENEFITVGPTIGSETTTNALLGVSLASVLIVLYIGLSFRKVPKPASSWRFGICAIIALLHDAFVLLGVFSLLGHFLGVQVDSLFITATLTVIGFSVHDTIVVFDRIRENLTKLGGSHFADTVNASISQTMTRSLNTSMTVILVLLALLLFGGESTTWFVAALLIGVISGTYSSIFNAAPLLVVWQEFPEKRKA